MNAGDIPIPPDDIRVGRKRSYQKVGVTFVGFFEELCRLKPDATVLEIGCGTGRIAAALTDYLTSDGRYEGLDIVKNSIAWCSREISSRFPNFHFTLSNIYNSFYNPDGKEDSWEYRFPYADDQFDLVFLASVFTHMLPDGLENYLREVVRMLKVGGNCLITYFLLNDESRDLIRAGKANKNRDFEDQGDIYSTRFPDFPNRVVAYEETYIRELYAQDGLFIEEPIHYGSWCGREKFLNAQDIIIAHKSEDR